MVILADEGDIGSMDWWAAAILGLPVVIGPQLILLGRLSGVSRINFPRIHRWALVGVLFGGLALLVLALRNFAAVEVRTSNLEILVLTAVGGVWQIGAVLLFPWFGLSVRDDAMERRNSAAFVASLGALVAAQLVFIGGNIGEGPSYWENVFSVTLAAGGLLTLWLLLQFGADVSRSIAEDRDLASGVRLGAFLLACGLILGRAVAGNWHSEAATIHDFFHDGWPAAALCLLALPLEHLLRPSKQRPFHSWPVCGALPAFLYLGVAVFWLYRLGPWEGFVQ